MLLLQSKKLIYKQQINFNFLSVCKEGYPPYLHWCMTNHLIPLNYQHVTGHYEKVHLNYLQIPFEEMRWSTLLSTYWALF